MFEIGDLVIIRETGQQGYVVEIFDNPPGYMVELEDNSLYSGCVDKFVECKE